MSLSARSLVALASALVFLNACDSSRADHNNGQGTPEGHRLTAASNVIYDDSLENGYQDWSWATHSLTETQVVHAGKDAISLTASNYAGLLFVTTTGWTAAQYSALDFYVYGTGTGNQSLLASLYYASGSGSTEVNVANYATGGKLTANTWVHVQIPLSAMGATSASITGITLQGGVSGTQTAVYVDDMTLIAAGQTTTGSTATTGTTTGKTTTTGGTSTGATSASTTGTTTGGTSTGATSAGTTGTTTGGTSTGATSGGTTGTTNGGTSTGATSASSTGTSATTGGSGTTTTSGGTGASSTGTTGGATQTVYSDALAAGFSDWSWATHSLSEKTVVHSGSNGISFSPNDYQGLMFVAGTPWASTTYTAFEFWVYPTAANEQLLASLYYADGTGSSEFNVNTSMPGGTLPANTWTHVVVPYSSFAANPNVIGLVIQSGTSANQAVTYIDDIAQVLASGGITTTAGTTTTTGGTTATTGTTTTTGGTTATAGTTTTTGGTTATTGGTTTTAGTTTTTGGTTATTGETTTTAGTTTTTGGTAATTGGTTATTGGTTTTTTGGTTATTGGTTTSTGGASTGGSTGTGHVVYSDALTAGFADWSWATHSLIETAVVHSGTDAVSFTPSAYAGIMFVNATPWAPTTYTALEFWVYPTAANETLLASLYLANGTGSNQVKVESLAPNGVLPANTWTHIVVPYASMNPNSNVTGVVIQGEASGTQAIVYVDDIAQDTASSGTSTGTAGTGGTTGTTGGTTSGTTGGVTVAPVEWPAVLFTDNPGGNDPKAVALSFDDGPDGSAGGQNNTGYVLNQLKALGLHATFFVCGDLWTDVTTDTVAQADLQRIISEGHDIGSHTLNHPYLDTLTQAGVAAEFSQNLTAFQNPNVFGPSFKMSMYRAPFGVPFQENNPNVVWVAPPLEQFGVHVGWGIDSDDWKCAQNNQDANCIINNVNFQLNQGHSGVILMHAVYKLTGDALPAVVQAIYAHGYHIVQVQDFIKAKYGVTSDQLLGVDQSASFTSQQIGNAAVNQCSENDFSIDPPY